MKSVARIAEDLASYLRAEGSDVVTFSRKTFYAYVERQRIKAEFMVDLGIALRRENLLLAEGESAVLVAKDYNFQPIKA